MRCCSTSRRDRLVAQLVDVRGAHVVVRAPRPERVEQALHGGVRDHADQVRDRVAQRPSAAASRVAPCLGLAGVDRDDRHDRLAVRRLGEERRGRRRREVHERRHLVRQSRDPVAVEPQDLLGAVAGEEDRAGEQRRPDRVSRNSSEVAIPKLPPPPRRPHSSSGFSSSLVCTSRPSAVTTSAPIRLSHARPILRISQPMPPPSVKPGDPGARHEAAGHREPEGLRLVVEVRPRAAALGRRRCDVPGRRAPPSSRDRSMTMPPSQRGEAGQRVAAAAHGDDQVLAAREVHRLHHVRDAGAAHDQRRALVVGAVPDGREPRRSRRRRAGRAGRAGPARTRPAWRRRARGDRVSVVMLCALLAAGSSVRGQPSPART